MCYNPIDIVNPHKYVSLKYRDRYLIQVPCGKCAACRAAKSNEWSYRLYHHALDTFRNGFVLFDTLTYDNEHLPHISDYVSIPKELDFPCFSSRDLRLFVANLRQRCKRYYRSNFSYFIASEYGTSENHLHRPHYHVLFFVTGSIEPVEFSRLVAITWNRGRTDGIPFRSSYHVENNTFRDMSAGALRSLKYVCKYIQKNSLFEREVSKRLDYIMREVSNRFESQGLESWSESSHYWRLREKFSRCISQFHRQSTFLGASVLGDIDLVDVMRTGTLKMPDNEFVVKSIPLPTYYKRKLFYQLLEVDGSLTWQPTDFGLVYLKLREQQKIQEISRLFDASKVQLKLDFDSQSLADYVVNKRGRFIANFPPSTIEQRLQNVDLYNYANRYDKEWFGRSGLSRSFVGNSRIGYMRNAVFVPISHFIQKCIYFDKTLEDYLLRISAFRVGVDSGRQRLYEYQQKLSNLLHHFALA